MGHVPDHTPAAAAVEHAALIAALDAGDLAGIERDRAATLAGTCTGCASLLADLAIIRAATAALPAAPRTRDYRLTDVDAARLRPSAWGRLVGWLGAPRSTVRPLAGGLAALGIAGLLLSTTPGLFGQAAEALRFTSLPATGAPVTAPGEAGGAGSWAEGNAGLSATPSTPAGPDAAATAEPSATSAPGAPDAGAPDTTPGAAALPAPSPAAVEPPVPSPAAVALPAPAGPATSPVLTGPATAASPGPSGFSTNAGAMDSGSKAAPPEASSAQRNAALPPASEPATPDRTLPLVLSLALVAAGIGLFAANRVLRSRAEV
jgi:hypothetical protein